MLVYDVGQLLALYFSLVVLFRSDICRLYWCFIIVIELMMIFNSCAARKETSLYF